MRGVVYAYAAASVVGLVLLAASLLGAGGDHAAGHDAAGVAEHASPTAAFLSVRVWTYFLAFGGATGLLLRYLAPVAEPLRALLALLVGVLAAAFARVVVARAAGGGPSGTVRSEDMQGRTGGVLVPFGSGATGKVRVRVAGSDVDLLATTDEAEPLRSGEEVLVVEVRDDGTALVTRAPR
jgi:membrane protein implicated in regulation of membrane protease activity